MSSQPDSFDEFLRKVEPLIQFTPLYKSLDFACVAARQGSEWVLIAGRAFLSTEACGSNPEISPLVRLDHLLALSGTVKIEAVNHLMGNLRNSMVITGLGPDNVRLTPAKASANYSWSGPTVYSVNKTLDPSSRWSRSLWVQGSGPDVRNLLSYGLWQEIDSQLRHSSPAFNGFDALCGKLRLPSRRNEMSYSSFQLSAELPARFLSVQTDFAKRTLEIGFECIGKPELMIDWWPGHDFQRVQYDHWQSESTTERYRASVGIPDQARRAELMMSFAGLEAADNLTYSIGAKNTLLRIVDFFDPEQRRLSAYLYEKTDAGANAFELGVARLLSTAGFVVLWFGKASKEASPDIVAYWKSLLGEEYIVLGECTMKDPIRKVSDLADRGRKMSEIVDVDPGRFLQVLFTRTGVTDPDVAAAAERGVVLCGAAGLKELQQQVAAGATPLELYRMIEQHASLAGLFPSH